MPTELPWPCLCLVTDRRLGGEEALVYKVAQAVAGGGKLVQLREKDLPGRPLLSILQTVLGWRGLLEGRSRVPHGPACR